jgi:hypothetical protein
MSLFSSFSDCSTKLTSKALLVGLIPGQESVSTRRRTTLVVVNSRQVGHPSDEAFVGFREAGDHDDDDVVPLSQVAVLVDMLDSDVRADFRIEVPQLLDQEVGGSLIGLDQQRPVIGRMTHDLTPPCFVSAIGGVIPQSTRL